MSKTETDAAAEAEAEAEFDNDNDNENDTETGTESGTGFDTDADMDRDARAEAGQEAFDPDVTGYFPAIRDTDEDADEDEDADADTAEDVDTAAGAQAPGAFEPNAGYAEPGIVDDGTAGAGVPVGATGPAVAEDRLAHMRQIQLAFIDDPRQAALDAQDLLDAALRSAIEELAGDRDSLQGDPPLDGDGYDTERMRLVVRRSRQVLDALTAV